MRPYKAIFLDWDDTIGDSYSSDIAGAKAAGIDQIWVKGDGFPVTGETATYIVPKLIDVMKIL